jgi:two-component system response regulator PilR (NtrC family)
LAGEALQALRAYAFPGNVRELENILERAVAFANDGMIAVADLALKPCAPNSAVQDGVSDGVAAARLEAAAAAPANGVAPNGLPSLPCNLPDHLDEVEREIIRRALAKTQFNRTQAADLLGISFRQLRYRMQRLGVNEPD